MRIEVRRTGGFAGIERRAEVDTSGRPDADAWQALAGAVLEEAAAGAARGVGPGCRTASATRSRSTAARSAARSRI